MLIEPILLVRLGLGPGSNSEQFCDAKLSSIRYWHSYLSDNLIRLHAQDIFNYGPESVYQNVKPFFIEPFKTGKYVKQLDTLALHWDFATVSSSNNGSRFGC